MAQQPQMPKPTSFFSSVMSGIAGYVKGALAGGVVGAIGGAVVGAAIGAFTIATGGTFLAALATVGTAAAVGGVSLASIGSIAGAMTGVVKSREAGQPSASDVVNVAKISFAQGVAVGHNIEHSANQQQSTTHRDRVTQERAAVALSERQVTH